MPDTIAIICTVDEIVPHSLGDPNSNRHFSLNLSVSLTKDSSGGVPATPDMFQPWNWTALTLKILADAGASGTAPAGTPVSFTPVAAPAIPATIAKALQDRFSGQTDPLYFRWADQPGGVQGAAGPTENWSRVLAHASTWPAPVPAALNLAFHFTVKQADLAGKTRLFVAPVFTNKEGTFTPQNVPALQSNLPAGTPPIYIWTYTAGASAFQPEYALKTLPTPAEVRNHGPFLDFNTYWIATADGSSNAPEAAASEDWRFSLEQRAADAFDLVQRILVVLRENQALLTGQDRTVVFNGLVAALRDNADYGLRYAPDGSNTLRYVLTRPNVLLAAGAKAEDDPGYVQTLSNFETALRKAAATLDWNSLLKRVLNVDVHQVPGDMRSLIDAVDSLQSALAQTANLANMLFTQWNDALQTTLPWPSISQAVNNELQALAGSRVLRSRMLQANLGGDDVGVAVWKALTDTPTGGYKAETDAVAANLQALIPAWFRERFGLTPTDPQHRENLFSSRLPAITGWKLDLSDPLAKDAARFQLFHDSGQQPTRASHPLIVQIGNTMDIDESSGLFNDPARRIAGTGLLVREHLPDGSTGPWASANAADLFTTADGGKTQCALNVMAPLRPKKRSNLNQPVLAFAGGSLVSEADLNPASHALPAQSPNADAVGFFGYFPDALPTAGTVAFDGTTLTIPRYTAPDGTKSEDWKRVPILKDGRTYDLLPFMIGNNGALPFELASAADPTQPVTPKDFDASFTARGLTGYIRTVPYNRRVGVGPARLRKAADASIQDQLPPIPTSVVPLARDFSPVGPDNKTVPLLLLWNAPNHANFRFTLRPPACDLETWDRWVAGLVDADPADKTKTFRHTRIAAATALGLFTPKSNADQVNADPDTAPDLSIDDPAVNALQLSMAQVYPLAAPGSNPNTVPPQPLGMFAPLRIGPDIDTTKTNGDWPKALLTGLQDPGVIVNVKLGAKTDQAGIKPDGTVTVPEGQVWRLTVLPSISAPGNFEGVARNNPASFDLLIEGATAGAFDPAHPDDAFQAALWKNLAVQFNAGLMTVKITPPKPTTPNWDLIHNIDLRKQAWRWLGRPLAPYPPEWATKNPEDVIDADPLGTNSRMWEIGSFAERSDDDCSITQTAVNFGMGFTKTNPTGVVTLQTADLSQDARAQYYRFAIDVHSRYEGLAGLALAPLRATSTHIANGPFTVWRRCVVPPQLPPASEIVAKPKILMALPFMESTATGDPPPTPGLLVIANEQWFDKWGLAEQLQVTLDQARDPSVPLSVPIDQANPLAEAGLNPTLSAARLPAFTAPPPATVVPMGTTFDQATAAPLFANTCFRVDPVQLGLSAAGTEHIQARVRFTRAIDGTAFGVTGAAASIATDSFLVEFQPGNRHVNIVNGAAVSVVEISSLRFAVSFDAAAGNVLNFSTAGTVGTATIQPGPPASDLFDLTHMQLWALVMRQVTDATGKPQQLAAVDIFVQDARKPENFIVPGKSAIDATNCIVYLIEVLSVPKAADLGFGGGIASAAGILFPAAQSNQQPQEAQARIKRVFESISN